MLTGAWAGEYRYGECYRTDLKGRTEAFTIQLREWAGSVVEGECVDERKKELAPAAINGSIKDGILHFIKQYPFSSSMDKHGQLTIDNNTPSPEILYVGSWDKAWAIVFGIWEMKSQNAGLSNEESRKLERQLRMRKVK